MSVWRQENYRATSNNLRLFALPRTEDHASMIVVRGPAAAGRRPPVVQARPYGRRALGASCDVIISISQDEVSLITL